MNIESPGPGACGSSCLTELAASLTMTLILLLVAVLTGCTNLQPVAMDPETLQEQISNGTAMHEGETVRVVTRDGASHLLVVTVVEEDTLRGHALGARAGDVVIEIPLDDILLLEKEKVNAVETTAGSVGIATILFAAALIIAPFAVLGALGL